MKPNIIYFVIHDIGKHLGIYGAKVATLNIDSFAKQGACFSNAFCAFTPCSPSRACAMTGQYARYIE